MRNLLSSWARHVGELGLRLKGGPWAFWAEDLRRLARAFEDVDDAASHTMAGRTVVARHVPTLTQDLGYRPGQLIATQQFNSSGNYAGLTFSAHPAVVLMTNHFTFGRVDSARVEVARRFDVPRTGDAIRWVPTPWTDDPVRIFYHRAGGDVLVPVLTSDGSVVYSRMHASIFGRRLWAVDKYRDVLQGRSIALLPYHSATNTGAATEASAILAGLREAGMPHHNEVWAASAGVVPTSVPGAIPGLEFKSWLTLTTDDVEDVAQQPFWRVRDLPSGKA